MHLIQRLHSHASQRPGDIALRQIIPDNGRSIIWRELAAQVETVSRALGAGLPAGAVVMLCSGNRPEYVVAFLAILAAKMTVFPIAPDMAGPELFSAGQRSGAVALLAIGQPNLPVGDAFVHRSSMLPCGPDAVAYTKPAWPVTFAQGPALLLLSSGTTDRPKIVLRDAASIDAVSENMVDAIGFQTADRVLAAVPLCHSYGMEHGLLCPIWAGCATHLYDRFDLPAAVAELKQNAVTVFPGVPFMFETLLGAGDLPARPLSLRRAYSAGGPLPAELFESTLGKFSIPVAQLYGATEIGSVTFNDPALNPFDAASVGRPMRDVSIKILDASAPDIGRPLPIGAEGHVAIAAPSMLTRYIDGDPPPLLQGHFLTGDLGRIDFSGALTITGRIKLLIDVAGRKVNPLEVEREIASHPSVGECVVVPLRISPTLCRLKAFVTPAAGCAPPDIRTLRLFARQHLSAYKVPRIFEVRDALPRSATGKVLRRMLEDESG